MLVEKLFEVIHEDSEFLVINKPAGLVCHPTKTDEYSSLISRVRLYLGEGSRPQLINRLDRETSGVTLVAKEEQVARKARRLWENRQVTKEYLAIVHGHVVEPYQLILARLGKDEQSAVAIKDCVRDDGAEARTEVWRQKTFYKSISSGGGARQVGCDNMERLHAHPTARGDHEEASKTSETTLSKIESFSLLKVVPHTGRKHQIRIHLAHLGHPIVGDKLYGESEDCYLALVEDRLTPKQLGQLILPYHALHASKVRFEWGFEENVFQAEPEPWFKAFCSSAEFSG
jgi:23S rRNA pseudouridine1911/1915/1917 synthase